MIEVATERLLTGRECASPPPVRLRAGRTTLLFVDGDLRYVQAGGAEVVRRVYVGVRDLDWNTLPGESENLHIEDRGNSFLVTFERRHRLGELDYRWSATIAGDREGRITYEMVGEALTGFSYAKIGICVHHPVKGFVGSQYSGVTPTGPIQGRLPDAIGPQVHLADGTDLPLFDPFSELQLSHEGGGTVAFEFTGDLWEIEDQRNWTDQSFKSASTPASLGYRHEAVPGQRFHQRVTMQSTGFDPLAAAVPDHDTILVGPPKATVVPAIGVSATAPALALSERASGLLSLIRLAHVRCDIDLASGPEERIAVAAARATELHTKLELAAFTTEEADRSDQLARLCRAVADIRPVVSRILLFSKDREATTPQTATEGAEVMAQFPEIPLVIGSDANFNELNRNRPQQTRASGLVWSVNPQVHASDELSLVENLEAQGETVSTARSFAPGCSLHVSPVTLRPRFNAVSTTGVEFEPEGMPWNTDPRQASLFAAAWTLGSVAALTSAGVESVTYYDMVGPRGIIESPEGSPYPDRFPSLPDTPYPLALVLAEVCDLRGARLLHLSGFDPLRMTALACETACGRVLLIANLTRRDVSVEVAGFGKTARSRILDATNVRDATANPRAFLLRDQPPVLPGESGIHLRLGPYAFARLDSER